RLNRLGLQRRAEVNSAVRVKEKVGHGSKIPAGISVSPSTRTAAAVPSYMSRLKKRRADKAMHANLLFGVVFGWLLTIVGTFRWLFLVEGDAWLGVAGLGVATLAVTLVIPELLEYPQALLKAIGSKVGDVIFKAILSASYFLVVLPAGLVAR